MSPLLHWIDSLSSASCPTRPKQRTDRFVNKRPLDISPRSFVQTAYSPSIVMLDPLSQTKQNLSHIHRPAISAGSFACDIASEATTISAADGPNSVLRIATFLSLRVRSYSADISRVSVRFSFRTRLSSSATSQLKIVEAVFKRFMSLPHWGHLRVVGVGSTAGGRRLSDPVGRVRRLNTINSESPHQGDGAMPESANHRRGTALAKCFGLMTFAILAMAVPAAGQDRTKPGAEVDRSAAVMCPWLILLAVQARTADCGWARQPADDAIDEAIAAIDDFILAYTPSHPMAHPMLEDLKRSAAAGLRGSSTRQQNCEDRNNEFLQQIRSNSPDQIREAVKVLLSTPYEPGRRYPCL